MTPPEQSLVEFSGQYIRVPYSSRLPLSRTVPLAEKRSPKNHPPHWTVPLPDAPALVAWADEHGVQVDPAVRRFATSLWSRELAATARSTAVDLGFDEPSPVHGLTATLMDMQQVPVQAASTAYALAAVPGSSHRALLVADEPGLGKSIIALASSRLRDQQCARTVIVCPTSLTENWQSEMVQHFDLGVFRPWVAQGLTPSPVPPEADVVVIGWDVLAAWVDALIRWKPDAVIADEGHYAKSGKQRTRSETQVARDEDGEMARDDAGNLKFEKVTKVVSGSARATAVLRLGAAVTKSNGLVMALTGTPIVNRPLELLPLLEFVGVLHLFGGSTAFKNRFCGPKKINTGSRTVTSYTGASNLLELNSRLVASGHYVRRTKESLIAAGLMPEKFVDGVTYYDHHTRPNPWIITPNPAEAAEYAKAEDELAGFFAERATEFARTLRAPVASAQVRKKVAADAARHLKRIVELRRLAAKIKVKYVIAKVSELVDRGEKVVIAAHHRDIVDAYADAFTGLKIQGDMTVQKVEQVKALFNTTPTSEHPVLVLSVEAGKTGHTLCKQALHGVGPACAYMVFAEQVWTPGDETQAQDRIYRIGQDRTVRIVNALLANSIDMSIFTQRARKRAVVAAAIDAVDPDARSRADNEREGVGLIATELAYRHHQPAPAR